MLCSPPNFIFLQNHDSCAKIFMPALKIDVFSLLYHICALSDLRRWLHALLGPEMISSRGHQWAFLFVSIPKTVGISSIMSANLSCHCGMPADAWKLCVEKPIGVISSPRPGSVLIRATSIFSTLLGLHTLVSVLFLR